MQLHVCVMHGSLICSMEGQSLVHLVPMSCTVSEYCLLSHGTYAGVMCCLLICPAVSMCDFNYVNFHKKNATNAAYPVKVSDLDN